MEYLLYVAGGIIGICSIGLMVRPKRGKRFAYNIIYLLPFWVWGVMFLILSSLVWHSRDDATLTVLAYLAFITLFAGGLILLFLPKRRIKKALELFLSSSEKKVRLIGTTTLLVALMILLSA